MTGFALKIFIPIFSSSVAGKRFPASNSNPGCGGTQHVAVVLARRLAESRRDWRVVLVNDNNFSIEYGPPNLEINLFDSWGDFVKQHRCYLDEGSVVIAPASLLEPLDRKELSAVAPKMICWIHHPFFLRPKLRDAGFAAHVAVGCYQWYSLERYYPRLWHIQNIFPRQNDFPQFSSDRKAKGPGCRLVHLGALVPGKGFDHIAGQWGAIKDAAPEATLDVIGGVSTYGGKIEHALVPAQREYAQKITRLIGEDDIRAGRVVFHGNLGDDKQRILEGSDLAIQNLTGATEAFPASVLECLDAGVPVIGSSHFGMGDAMRFFPETTVRLPSHAPMRLANALRTPLLLEELRRRSDATAEFFALRSEEALIRWQQLLTLVSDRGKVVPREPSLPWWGSRLSLRFKRQKAKAGMIARTLSR